MASQLERSLDALAASRGKHLLGRLTRGIEKESLRVLPERQSFSSATPIGVWALR